MSQRQGISCGKLLSHEITGRDLRFSGDSNMVAVWDSSQLSIYMFGIGGYRLSRLNNEDRTKSRTRLSTSTHLGVRRRAVMWSADSTTLAWQDASGIWRWNLYADGTAHIA